MKTCPTCGGSGHIEDPRVTGKKMRREREAAGLPLQSVAQRADISTAYLCDLEFGRRAWRPELVTRVLKAINLNP